MARAVERGGKRYYQCGSCGLLYEEKAWAEKCDAWCRRHRSCSLEITSHAFREV